MPSTNLSTSSYGDAQRQGKVLVAAGAASSIPGLVKYQSRSAAGTLVTYNLWVSSDGRLRYSTTEPSDQLTSGTDVVSTLPAGSIATADLADGAVTPLKSSTAMQEMPLQINPYPEGAQAAGVDVANRIVYRTSATNSLNAGRCYVHFYRTVGVPSGQTLSLGLGTTAANDLFGRSFTSSQSAGTITSLTAGSVTAISTNTNVRFDGTLSSTTTVPAGAIMLTWVPQKRGSN